LGFVRVDLARGRYALLAVQAAAARSGDCADAEAQARAASATIQAGGLAAHPELAIASTLLRHPLASCGLLLN
jgi:serine/threonine-protein kinase